MNVPHPGRKKTWLLRTACRGFLCRLTYRWSLARIRFRTMTWSMISPQATQRHPRTQSFPLPLPLTRRFAGHMNPWQRW